MSGGRRLDDQILAVLRGHLANIISEAVFLFIGLTACSIAANRRRSGVRLFIWLGVWSAMYGAGLLTRFACKQSAFAATNGSPSRPDSTIREQPFEDGVVQRHGGDHQPVTTMRIRSTTCAIGSAAPCAQAVPQATGDARVDTLLSQMTLEEKLTLIHDGREDPATYQGQAGYIGGVSRLGIPGLRMADGPPGVLTRQPSQAATATMAVAATFNVGLARQNGVVIGREARALGIDVTLQPYINIDRDLTFKRAYNTFGEDPLLTSRIGAAEIEGIQSQHVMAMAKHFIGYDSAGTDVWIDEQTLHEVYLPPFEAAIGAGVAAIMCSYNHLNGPYACGNDYTLTAILRRELGFKGFVTSDWSATHSALFMNVGLDVEMIDGPDSSGYQMPAYMDAEAASVPGRPIPRARALATSTAVSSRKRGLPRPPTATIWAPESPPLPSPRRSRTVP